ncbi:MAG TPA: neutral/alkaline non-lysosomal ceramidase N-terminal domain-containing protein [Planctomycetota bacterium]|nr:neutral/alkaline non-lysosomal ceramidase N-terminal domain-containing protein [Planctomycetota bacterium]HRR81025.1 neutral/alkaline non-lysosomal ceramidase N-terminal domain-containing protein [Planctomycetota bacterium]HRT93625.1 neutral/alkaline non-lysosomal ceramidase N-terminal domain-containing protein [Planctomycetota bacterium]
MRAGSARIEITPPKGLPMGGYVARADPAQGIHDPLFARALVLDDGAQRVALISADLPEVTPAFANDVRGRIAQELGIPPTHSLLAVSHTHAGPLVAGHRVNTPDPFYLETLHDRLLGVVRAAARVLRPASIGAGRGKVYLGVNRRAGRQDTGAPQPQGRPGYASPYTRVLVAAEQGGGPLAILFTYGAHPNVLGPENLQISGDYAGFAERAIEENYGGNAVGLFALGFAGDVDAQHSKRSFDEAETLGTALSRAVLEEMKAIRPADGLALRARVLRVPLPLQPPPSLEEAERLLFAERERLNAILGRGEDKAEIIRRRIRVDWASQLVQAAHEGRQAPPLEVELQGIAIGPIALLGVAAKPFAEYEKILLELSPFPHTFPLACVNGSIGYVPTATAFAEGGYEVEAAPRLYGTLPLRPEVESTLRLAFARLLADLTG